MPPANKINLFVSSYDSKSPARQRELDLCLKLNRQNPLLNVKVIHKQDRITFSELVSHARRLSKDNVVSIISNSDIVFDDTVALALLMLENQCFWLSRYDGIKICGDVLDITNKKLNKNNQSSDSWIFRGKIKPINNIDFGLGMWGCDGAFANRLRMSGYTVSNPSESILTYHVHESDLRTLQMPPAPQPWDTVNHSSLTWENKKEFLKKYIDKTSKV